MKSIASSYPQQQPSPPPNLKLVRDEADAPYDGQTKAERNAGDRFAMIPACVWDLHEPYPILVYGALALHADRDGLCWPSMATIAKQVGISERSVLRAIERLEDVGVIVREHTTVHGMKGANRYRLVPHKSLLDQYRHTVSTSCPTVSYVPPDSQFRTDSQSDEQYPREQNPREQKETPPLPPKGPSALEQRFDRFWAIYPRKEAKAAAKRTWMRLRPNDDLTATMVAAIERQKHSEQWRKDGGRYIPHPATWLNQGRWEDEGTAVTKPKPRYVV